MPFLGRRSFGTTNAERTGPPATAAASASNAKAPPKKFLPAPKTPHLQVTRKLFDVSPDAKHVFCGGHWDNSLQVSDMNSDF